MSENTGPAMAPGPDDSIVSTPTRRRVESGTWPCYVMLLICLLLASGIQAVKWEPPPSVATQSPPWFDPWYMVGQPIGALITLVALLGVRNIVASLQLERVGCIVNATIGATYFVAVTLNNGSVPSTGGTWLAFGFGLYCLYRAHEITKTFGTDILRPLRPLVRRGRA